MAKILSLALLLCLFYTLGAQEIIYENYGGNVDIWVLLPYNSLNFKKDLQEAEYQVSLQLKNHKNKQVASFEKNLLIPKRGWLDDTAIPMRFNKLLSPGIYSAELKLKNKSLGEKRNFKKQFEIFGESTGIGLSWIVAWREGIGFIPNNFGSSIRDVEKVMLQQSFSLSLDSLRIGIDKQNLTISNPISPIELDLKQYLPPDAVNAIHLTLYEGNIHYKPEPFLFSPWYSYSLRYSLEDQMAQLRYIATQNEWQVLRQLPKDNYAKAIEGFWKAIDPSPGTVRNETREKFYQRVLRSDEMFTVHKKLKGWSSDRGRIYIKYGEPDEINTEVYPLGRYPNIIWTYYKQNLDFVFADTKGFGQYTLRNKEDEY